MRLWAISDLHVRYPQNRQAVQQMGFYSNDWLIVAGNVGETVDHLDWTLGELRRRFAKVFWVPGNHDLWSTSDDASRRGVERYMKLVDICHRQNCITPEDDCVFVARNNGHVTGYTYFRALRLQLSAERYSLRASRQMGR